METLLKAKAGAPGENTDNHSNSGSFYADSEVDIVEKLSLRKASYLTPAEDPYNVQTEVGRVFINHYFIDSLEEDEDDDDIDDLDEVDLDEDDIVEDEEDDVTDDDIEDDIDLDEDDEDDDDLI